MKINELITEVLNQPYPIDWNLKKNNEWYGLAKDGEFHIQIKEFSPGYWSVLFRVGGSLEKTNAGDQFRIFATAKQGIAEWWKSNKTNVDGIMFSADKILDNSRATLYNRLAKQFATSIGYELEVSRGTKADIYNLKKPEVSENTNQRSKITEALDNPYPYTWTVDEEEEKIAVAEIDRGEKLEIYFEAFEEDHTWEITFKVDAELAATGQGDQFRIFATVVKAVKEWLQQMLSSKQPLRRITFRAFKDDENDTSREKLYSRFAKRITDTIGFKFSKKDYGDEVAFNMDNPDYQPMEENQKPVIDMLEEAMITVSNFLDETGKLSESSNDWNQYNELVSRISSEKPIIGSEYAVLNLVSVPTAKFILTQGHATPVRLNKIDNSKSYTQYEFDLGDKIVKYPGDDRSGDRLSQTFFYKNSQDLQKTLAFIALSLDNWDIRNKLNENFADGKKKGKSRPGRFKRAGVSCKGSVTSLRKKAKNSSGEKQKGYHWCANMKSGRKKK